MVSIMKNTKKSTKSIKTAIIISMVALAACIVGVVIEFVSKKTWDAAGCGILACNAAILFCNLDAYKKAKQEENN